MHLLAAMYLACYLLTVASYTYYKSLCQEKRLIDTGKQDDRKSYQGKYRVYYSYTYTLISTCTHDAFD